jgi:hypothetical protein
MEDSMERRGGLWAKHMGLKRGAIGNTLGEHIENLMGTHWELEGNMLGTKEKNPPAPHPKLKRVREREKKKRHFECMLSLLHWLHEISLSKIVGHHFWPGLIPPL